jgi:P4 family phage/plasmid primase-like protien
VTALLLPVLPGGQKTPGWPKHHDAPRIGYVDAAEAFTSSWPSDAHFAAYSVPGVEHRLTLDAIGRLPGGWPMVLLVVDVDGPGHKREPAWWTGELLKLEALAAAHPGGFFYATRGGYRLVYRLASPVMIRTVDDKEAWRERYRRELLYLARHFAIVGDPACSDITRLYRLPRVIREAGAPVEDHPTMGDPAALGVWTHEPSAEELERDVSTARTLASKEPNAWGPVLRALEVGRGRQDGEAPAPELRPEDQDEARLHKRAAAYLATMASNNPSVAGNDGHGALWAAAVAMVRGFNLGPSTGLAMLLRDFNPRCSPPWPRADVEHKCREAAERSKKPWGYLRDADGGDAGLKNKPGKRQRRQEPGGSPDTREAFRKAREEASKQRPPSNEGAPMPEHEHDQEGEKQAPASPDPWRYHTSDLGNGERFAAQHGRDLRHCPRWGKWLVWDGFRWAEDDRNHVRARAKATALSIYQEGRSLRGDDEREQARRKALAVWAAKSEGRDRCESMVAMAQSEPGIPIVPHELDRDPWLLNVENGTIDLRTGELRPHRREDLITRLAPVAYDPRAEAPAFRAFLDAITNHDLELQGFLQRFFGYALTGEIREHVLVMAYGTGSNGKSTLLKAFLDLLGDYAYQAPADLIMAKKGETHPTDQAGLFGRRLAVCMETPEGRSMDEARMKALTGGDLITARRMREDFWTFAPTHKLILATNHKPNIRTTDHGTWRRQKLVPFTVQIPSEKQDKTLPAKLTAEASGLLRWAVEGCLAWQRQGLGEPAAVKAATDGWRQESDPVGAFLAAECELGGDFQVEASRLFAAYERFAISNDDAPMSKQAFGRRLTERGLASGKGTGGVRQWLGIKLRPEGSKSTHKEPGPQEPQSGGVADSGGYVRTDHAKADSPSAEPGTNRHYPPSATQKPADFQGSDSEDIRRLDVDELMRVLRDPGGYDLEALCNEAAWRLTHNGPKCPTPTSPLHAELARALAQAREAGASSGPASEDNTPPPASGVTSDASNDGATGTGEYL